MTRGGIGLRGRHAVAGQPGCAGGNRCFLGRIVGAAEQFYRSRYKLAANIGTQLIENGVKAADALKEKMK